MGFLTVRRGVARLFPDRSRLPDAGVREFPECVVLDADDGLVASDRPPVRIFMGTEAGQHRAERVLIYSIEMVRDRSRVYEIYLMKDLLGFDRRTWLTGFTNYRFAIPHFCGGEGRAIYNDVDQIYLTDPAELFDADLGEHGYLSINPRDTSVMLIDCKRMIDVWPLEACHRGRRKAIEARARKRSGLWGRLAPEWNARDLEYSADRSKCLHYTTIHTQPWRPFPGDYVYQRNPVGYVWDEIERAADAAGFTVFAFERPSRRYRTLVAALAAAASAPTKRNATIGVTSSTSVDAPREQAGIDRSRSSTTFRPEANLDTGPLEALLAKVGARTLLRYDVAGAAGGTDTLVTNARVHTTRFDPTEHPDLALPDGPFDAVATTAGFDLLSDEDVPWALDGLFRRAGRIVSVTVDDVARTTPLPGESLPRRKPRGFPWWRAQMEAVAARHPDVHWRLECRTPTRSGADHVAWREGGRWLGGMPRVWVVVDHKPGHSTQSLGLAEALGWPYEIKHSKSAGVRSLVERLTGPIGIDRAGTGSESFGPPWPDLVISTGWCTVPLVQWIREQSGGRTRLVQMGRKGGDVAERYDLVVTCEYLRYPPHARRMELLVPLSSATPQRLHDAAQRWPGLFGSSPRPHLVLLVGGSCAQYEIDANLASKIGQEVGRFAADAGGSVVAVTSRRTGAEASSAIERGLGDAGSVHHWDAARKNNPYLGYLATADAIVVTSDSESMLAEAVSTGKPVYIYPIPPKSAGPLTWLAAKVTERAYARPMKKKGTIRPQQGLEYLCSRLLERGVVRPPRELEELHRELVDRGLALPFGAPLQLATSEPHHEMGRIVARVRTMMGFVETDDGSGSTVPVESSAAFDQARESSVA